MIKAIAQTAKKDTGINRTNLLMILVQNNKVIILTIQKQEITELLVHRMVIHQLMKIANVTVKREYVLTVFQDFISMPMQHVRNFLKTVQLQTLMDNAQAAFKVLEYRMANVSNKFVTNPFVLPSTLINQNASHVLNAHTQKVDAAIRLMDTALNGLRPPGNAQHAIKDTSLIKIIHGNVLKTLLHDFSILNFTL